MFARVLDLACGSGEIDAMSRKTQATRARILNSCWEALEAGDPAAVRMADIAKRAGITRQALYLHFPTRAELLIATTHHIDAVKDIDERLLASRNAASGQARLLAFIDAWGGYIPEVYGVARALMEMQTTDPEAAAAWAERMEAVRHGCLAAVKALAADGDLKPDLTTKSATDLLAMLVSVRNWEYLRHERRWSQKRYVEGVKTLAKAALIKV